MTTYKYDSIETGPENGDENTASGRSRNKSWLFPLATGFVLGAAAAAALFVLSPTISSRESKATTTTTTIPSNVSLTSSIEKSIPMPAGVNLGSWLSLEDYFYVGTGAGVEVATPDDKSAAVCLPPLHTGHQGPRWQSETDLLASLVDSTGGSLAKAIKVFHAHHVSFISEDDLAAIAQLGIHHVRVPVSWCLTDNDPDTLGNGDNDEDAAAKAFTCPDPFYGENDDVLWPAIPRSLITSFLRTCAAHGILATLDIHTYPGATSPGTFSGLWPRPPVFWKHDDPSQSTSSTDIGRQLLRDFIEWIESLQTTDPTAFAGLGAISPMNEPAHLAGVFGNGDRAFLPALPVAMARDYLSELTSSSSEDETQVPDGPHLRVLLWLRDAVNMFRESSLPAAGKELQVNIHESIFSPDVLPPNDGNDPGGRHPGATFMIGTWWRRTTTVKERSTWAVLDMHHYHAWEPNCQGTSDGPPSGNYSCGNVDARTDALDRCATGWADLYRSAVGPDAKLMSGEFSASTHHRVRLACNDIGTLRASYLAQIEAAANANVELYFWSYKMPFGGAFRPAWSFKHLMFLLGVTSHPDESNYDCGEHVALQDEPTDDMFL